MLEFREANAGPTCFAFCIDQDVNWQGVGYEAGRAAHGSEPGGRQRPLVTQYCFGHRHQGGSDVDFG